MNSKGGILVFGLMRSTILLVAVAALNTVSFCAPFTPGNLVVYRVGSGTGNLVNTGNPVFLDEYTPSGTLVQTIALPTTANGPNKQLIAAGTATSEGLLSRSADGRYLVLTGYASDLGGSTALAGTTSATVPRTIGRVDANGNVDTSTALTDYASGNNPRSAASVDGAEFWSTGASGGVRHSVLGASTSTQLSTTVVNLRQVSIFGGQLFVSTGSGSAVRVGTVGSGLPTTSGQTISNLPGFPTSGSPYAFFFADLNAAVAGMDTLYVADDSVGITKYSFDGATWTVNGTNGIAGDAYRGLTGVQSGTTVTLYAARKGGSGTAGGGEIVSLVDDGTFSGVPTVLATAVANTAFRGIALTPAAGGTTSQPAITSIVLSGPDLILAGAGGTANTTFRVLSSTNITTTLDSWQPILTNTFDLNGQFTVTNAFSATEPQRFFILQTP